MKRISKNRIEFDCIVRGVNSVLQTSAETAEHIEAFIHYYDEQDEINLVLRGNYKRKYLEKIQEAHKNMEKITVIIEITEPRALLIE